MKKYLEIHKNDEVTLKLGVAKRVYAELLQKEVVSQFEIYLS